MFPMTIRKVSLDHRQGTKSYHLVLITDAKNNAVLINRWGKKGAWGQMKVECFPAAAGMAGRLYEGKLREKEKGGYSQTNSSLVNENVSDLPAFKRIIGPKYWPELGQEAVKLLGLEEIADRVTEPEEKQYVELPNGGFERVAKPPRRNEPAPIEQRYANDSQFGEF